MAIKPVRSGQFWGAISLGRIPVETDCRAGSLTRPRKACTACPAGTCTGNLFTPELTHPTVHPVADDPLKGLMGGMVLTGQR